MRTTTTLTAALALLGAGTTATAAGLDGSGPIICAATSAMVCARNQDCVSHTPEDVNLPVFWQLDPVAKTVKSRHSKKDVRTSQVANVTTSADYLILQGADSGFAWSVSVHQETGEMMLSGSRTDGFVVFGRCTSL